MKYGTSSNSLLFIKLRSKLLFSFVVCFFPYSFSFAQTHKGISFQGVIKLPSGELPTRSGVTVNARILSPNECILREEQFTGVNISNGYINIPIGTGTTVGYDHGLTLKQVMDNSSTFTGLTCLSSDGSVNGSVTTFDPSTSSGARKFRLSLFIDSTPVVADFNMRSMAYAINAESLNGKTDTDFIKTSANITQNSVESWFASAVMGQLLAGTYTAPQAASAVNVTGTVAIANGGTGATNAIAARTNLGLSAIAASGSASDLVSGTVPVARLGTGTADATTYLRGDGTWAAVAGGVVSVAGKSGAVTLQAADISDFNSAADARITAQKAQNNGLATLDGSGKVPSSQLALATTDIPSLDASKITSGTITQDVSATSVGGTTGSFTNLRIYDGTSQFLTMTLPTGGTGYSLKWPNAAGGNGQVLQTDASGNLSWVTPSSAGIIALTGDVTATGSGSVAATIAADAITTGKILDGTVVKSDLNFTGVNSATSGFVVVDSTGKFTDFACSTVGHVPTWTVVGWSCQAPSGGTVAGVIANAPLASSGGANPVISISNGTASGQTLRWDGSNWLAAQLSNLDVTGLGSLATKNSVDLSSADATGTLDAARMPALTGDITSSAGSTATTLSNTGVAAGTYSKVTVDAKGRVTTATNIGSSDVTTALGFTPLNKAGDVMAGPLGLNGVTSDPAGLVAGDKGKIWYRTDTNEIKYWNGSAAVALGASGAGLQSFNGLTDNAQTFVVNSSGTDVAFNSASGTHTLSIPSASATNRGVLTSADWTMFNNKLGTATSFGGDVSGSYNSLSVDKIKGTAVSATAPTSGQLLVYDGTTQYSPVSLSGDATISNSGALTIANGAVTSTKIADGSVVGTDLNFTGLNTATSGLMVVDATGKFYNFACGTNGHVATWTATGWACQTPNAGTVTGVTASAPLASSGGTAPVISISNGSATGQTLRWNGSNWVAAQLSSSDVTGLGSLSTKNSVDLGSTDATGTLDAARLPALTGDVTSSAGSAATTLSNTGVTAGTYSKVTVDAKGRVTSATNIGSSDVTTALGFTPLNKAGDVMAGLLGLNGVTSDPAGLVAGDKGKMWYRTDTNEIKYWNGSAAVALGASGAGLQSINGLTDNAQTIVINSVGSDVAINSASGAHTISIPSASATNRGVLTSADWATFNNKLSAVSNAANLANTKIWMGDAGGKAQEVSVSGDATLSNAGVLTLANSGATAGTYPKVTVDVKGRVTGGASLSAGDIPNLDWSKITTGLPTTLSGYGITDAISNVGGTPSIQTGTLASRPAFGTAGRIYIASDNNMIYRDTGAAWVAIGDGSMAAVTPNRAIISDGSGLPTQSAVTSTELGYLSGATSAVQTQLDGMAKLGGRTGGQSLNGGTASGESLTLESTSHATKGNVLINPSGGNVGIGTTSPSSRLHVSTTDIAPGLNTGFTAYATSNSDPGAFIQSVTGGSLNAEINAAGNYGNLFGGTAWSYNSANSTVSGVIGFAADTEVDDGTVGTNTTLQAMNSVYGGTITNQYGVYAKNDNSGGTITNRYGFYYSSSGSATNDYGIYIDSTVKNYLAGPVGIGTTNPVTKLDVAGSVRVGTDATACAVGIAGAIRYNSGNVEYCNGTAWTAFAANGTGITSFNGLTGTTQTFATPGTAGTAPNWSSTGSAHTLNIPMASIASVTAGLISKTDYDTFNAKLGTGTSFSGDVSGTYNATSVDKIKGTAVTITSLTNKDYLKYNGTAWVNSAINAATDLTGILPVANGGTGASSLGSGNLLIGGGTGAVTSLAAGSAGNVVYATGVATWASGSADTAGLVDKTSTQTISGAKAFTNYVQMAQQNEVRFADADSSNYVSIRSPATVASNVTLTLPTTAGTSGQMLSTDGAGVLSWVSGLTNATGFVNGGNSFAANATIGTNDNYSVTIETNGSARVTVDNAGKVGVANAAPRGTLDVSGVILSKAATAAGSSTIDYSIGNIQYTTSDCGAFQFNNLKDGGSYTFVVQGTNSTTCSFTAYSDAGTTALTVHLPPDHAATTAGKHTIYNMIVAGSHVYLAWIPGY